MVLTWVLAALFCPGILAEQIIPLKATEMRTMREAWHELEEFPDYAVSDLGDIANMKSGMPRKASINQQGVLKISLYNKEGRLMTRSVALLVARAFVNGETEIWDTPIHLDGDKTNCQAANLMWRPRWFAIKFHKQFCVEHFYHWDIPLYEIEGDDYYDSVRDACMRNGIHYQDVIKSFVEETFVPFTSQEFRKVS